MNLNFTNLPLQEVTIRVNFSEPLRLPFADRINLHNRLQSIFPEVEESGWIVPPQGVVFQMGEAPGSSMVVRGSGVRGIITPHSIMVQWTPTESPRYVRFDGLLRAFLFVYDSVAQVIGGLPVGAVNLMYKDLIPISADDANVRMYFREEFMPSVGAVSGVSQFFFLWTGEDFTDYKVGVYPVPVQVPSMGSDGQLVPVQTTATMIETVAGRHVGNGELVEPVCRAIHESLQGLFLKVISDDAMSEWGYVTGEV